MEFSESFSLFYFWFNTASNRTLFCILLHIVSVFFFQYITLHKHKGIDSMFSHNFSILVVLWPIYDSILLFHIQDIMYRFDIWFHSSTFTLHHVDITNVLTKLYLWLHIMLMLSYFFVVLNVLVFNILMRNYFL